jgi:O-methyltransferase
VNFYETFASVKDYTLLIPERLLQLWHLAQSVDSITEGDMIELGVYGGGTTALICRALPNHHMYLCDTWLGLPESKITQEEIKRGLTPGRFPASVHDMKNFLTFEGIDNYTIVQGIFPESITPEMKDKKFLFAHCDCDLGISCMNFLDFVAPRMVSGGIIVFDDYSYPVCEGVKRAADSFAKNNENDFSLSLYGAVCPQAVLTKRGK